MEVVRLPRRFATPVPAKGVTWSRTLYTTDSALLFLEECFMGAQYGRSGNATLLMALSLSTACTIHSNALRSCSRTT